MKFIPIDYGELLKWIGIWFLMATNQGPQQRNYWSTTLVERFSGALF